jgi:predicted hotdog family 3-hydroxylacyl-ACP dehydratase
MVGVPTRFVQLTELEVNDDSSSPDTDIAEMVTVDGKRMLIKAVTFFSDTKYADKDMFAEDTTFVETAGKMPATLALKIML